MPNQPSSMPDIPALDAKCVQHIIVCNTIAFRICCICILAAILIFRSLVYLATSILVWELDTNIDQIPSKLIFIFNSGLKFCKKGIICLILLYIMYCFRSLSDWSIFGMISTTMKSIFGPKSYYNINITLCSTQIFSNL